MSTALLQSNRTGVDLHSLKNNRASHPNGVAISVEWKRLSIIIFAFAFVPIVLAQTLPNIESDLHEREIGLEPRLVVWQRPEQSDVAVTVLVRFDETKIAGYGIRLPAVMSQLWDREIARNVAAEQVGITFLQERDSILNRLLDTESLSDRTNANLPTNA